MLQSLKKECIRTGIAGMSKEQIIGEAARLACLSGELKGRDQEVEDALLVREAVCSTGFSGGLAIPHCSFENITKFTVGLITVPEGCDFESRDGKLSTLIFFIIGPAEQRNRHIHILSSVSLLLKDDMLVKNLLGSGSSDETWGLLQGRLAVRESAPSDSLSGCQFAVFVQDEDIFEDTLELLSSASEGSVSVVETTGAGEYFNKIPLFATFWNDSSSRFSRMIIAVINKSLMNDTIRRLNMIKNLSHENAGIQVTVQDLLYTQGSLDF